MAKPCGLHKARRDMKETLSGENRGEEEEAPQPCMAGYAAGSVSCPTFPVQRWTADGEQCVRMEKCKVVCFGGNAGGTAACPAVYLHSCARVSSERSRGRRFFWFRVMRRPH